VFTVSKLVACVIIIVTGVYAICAGKWGCSICKNTKLRVLPRCEDTWRNVRAIRMWDANLLVYSYFIHILSYTLKTEAENYSEWSVNFYQTTRRHSIEAINCDFVKSVRSYESNVSFSLHYERLTINWSII
jgi:hypothetical protein